MKKILRRRATKRRRRCTNIMIAMIGGVVMKVDMNLVTKASSGDRDAFGELYNSCYKDLYKFALYTLGNADDAADVVSDTFVDIWRGLPKLREPEAFSSWVFRILSIHCKREIGTLIKKRNTFDIDDLIETPSDGSSVEEDISESAALAYAMAQLEPDERMIVVLSVLHGYTNREIADMMGKPQGTISSKLHRTYAKLREMLGGESNA